MWDIPWNFLYQEHRGRERPKHLWHWQEKKSLHPSVARWLLNIIYQAAILELWYWRMIYSRKPQTPTRKIWLTGKQKLRTFRYILGTSKSIISLSITAKRMTGNFLAPRTQQTLEIWKTTVHDAEHRCTNFRKRASVKKVKDMKVLQNGRNVYCRKRLLS